jgi:hypothetical protein
MAIWLLEDCEELEICAYRPIIVVREIRKVPQVVILYIVYITVQVKKLL